MDHLERLNDKLRARARIYGYTAYLPDTYTLSEYMPEHVDYILFDCEHGPYDAEHYAPYFRLCRARGIPTVLRVADAVYHLVARAADLGADGVLIPRVETLEQVRVAAEGLYLPPVGRKGFGGKWQFYPGETMERYQSTRLLWIQVESAAGADVLPEIIEKYGAHLSAVVIGPADLSINSGAPMDFYSPAVQETISRAYALCEASGISSGMYCFDLEDARRRIAGGANLIWMNSDANTLLRAIASTAAAVAQM